MKNFAFQGPYGSIECIVEPNRSRSKSVLIMAHGFRGSRDSNGKAAGIAYEAAASCNVIRFNFNGTRILSQQVAEIKAVIREVLRQQPDSIIYLLGRSMGGAASIVTASQMPEVKKLVLWSAPNNMRETFRHVMTEEYYPRLDAGETLTFTDDKGEFTLTPDFLTDFDQYDFAEILGNRLNRPVLLLHCEGDQTVLVEQAKENTRLLGKWGKLQLYPAGDHSIGEYSIEAGKLIAEFLN